MHTKTLTILTTAAVGAMLLGGCRNTIRQPMEGAETQEDISRNRSKALSLTQDGQRFEQAGRFTQAEAKYREAIALCREMAPAWNSLGQLLERKGDKLAAAEAFKTASELEPKDPVSLTNLGVLWESIGYIDDAARWYGEALKRDENHLPALRRLLVVEEARNHPEPVTMEHIRRALLIEKDPWWIQRFQRARGRFDQMISDYRDDAMSRPDLLLKPAGGSHAPVPATTPAPAGSPATSPHRDEPATKPEVTPKDR